jgi:hypothetical protein
MSKANSKPTSTGTVARVLALVIGTTAAGLQANGAYEMQLLMEGGVINYLVIAQPLIVLAAAIVPWIAESAWRDGERVKSLTLWITFGFVALVVFFNNSERMHAGKAGTEADRVAAHSAASRADTDLVIAKANAAAATTAADKVRGLDVKACGPKCLSIRATETAARARVTQAEAALRNAQGGAKADAPLKAPVWLTPFSLDWLTFTFGWYGLGLFRRREQPAAVVEARPVVEPVVETRPVVEPVVETQPVAKAKRSRAKRSPKVFRLRIVAANQNAAVKPSKTKPRYPKVTKGRWRRVAANEN